MVKMVKVLSILLKRVVIVKDTEAKLVKSIILWIVPLELVAAREIKERVALAKADGVTTPNLLMKMPKKKRREREKPVRIKVKDVREESVGHAETKKTRSLKRKRKKSDSLMMIIFNSSKQRTRTCLQLKEDNMRKSLTRNSKKTR